MAKKNVDKRDINSLNEVERKKLSDGINAAVVQTTYIETLKESLADSINVLSEELNLDKSLIKQAVQRIVKQDFFDKVRNQDDVEQILTVSGNLSGMSDNN